MRLLILMATQRAIIIIMGCRLCHIDVKNTRFWWYLVNSMRVFSKQYEGIQTPSTGPARLHAITAPLLIIIIPLHSAKYRALLC